MKKSINHKKNNFHDDNPFELHESEQPTSDEVLISSISKWNFDKDNNIYLIFLIEVMFK